MNIECQVVQCQLRKIDFETIIHVFVSFRLAYCNCCGCLQQIGKNALRSFQTLTYFIVFYFICCFISLMVFSLIFVLLYFRENQVTLERRVVLDFL